MFVCISLVFFLFIFVFFFFKQKTAYEMRISDWSSDVCSSDVDWGWSRRAMARTSRHFWNAGLTALAVASLALPPALAAMSNADRIRDTTLSETLLGQFTPASGDERVIARDNKMSAEQRSEELRGRKERDSK